MLPRWRMMMLPVTTCSPPYFLTPRYLGLESRPFLVEPVPFLCAASTLKERTGWEVVVGMATMRDPETDALRAARPETAVKPMRAAMVTVFETVRTTVRCSARCDMPPRPARRDDTDSGKSYLLGLVTSPPGRTGHQSHFSRVSPSH